MIAEETLGIQSLLCGVGFEVGCKGPFDNLCWIAREVLENRMIRWKGSFMEAEGRLQLVVGIHNIREEGPP